MTTGKPGLCVDDLPEQVRCSSLFTAAHLSLLAAAESIPVTDPAFHDEQLKAIFQYYAVDPAELELEIYRYAAGLLNKGQAAQAWQVLLTVL